MKYSGTKLNKCRTRETRALLGSRFKILLADAGLSHDAAAQLLHVTPRTIKYWVSGRVMVPYAAYKLVRVMRLFELPMPGWEGWHMHSGKLWTPEGYGFVPTDSGWWSNIVRKAHFFHQYYQRDQQLDLALQRMTAGSMASQVGNAAKAQPASSPTGGPGSPIGAAGRAPKAAGLNLSLGHIGTRNNF